MHPKLSTMQKAGLGVLTIIGVPLFFTWLGLSKGADSHLGLLYSAYSVFGISILLVTLPYWLTRLKRFEQIKMTTSISLGLFALRFYLADAIRAKTLPIPEIQIELSYRIIFDVW